MATPDPVIPNKKNSDDKTWEEQVYNCLNKPVKKNHYSTFQKIKQAHIKASNESLASGGNIGSSNYDKLLQSLYLSYAETALSAPYYNTIMLDNLKNFVVEGKFQAKEFAVYLEGTPYEITKPNLALLHSCCQTADKINKIMVGNYPSDMGQYLLKGVKKTGKIMGNVTNDFVNNPSQKSAQASILAIKGVPVALDLVLQATAYIVFKTVDKAVSIPMNGAYNNAVMNSWQLPDFTTAQSDGRNYATGAAILREFASKLYPESAVNDNLSLAELNALQLKITDEKSEKLIDGKAENIITEKELAYIKKIPGVKINDQGNLVEENKPLVRKYLKNMISLHKLEEDIKSCNDNAGDKITNIHNQFVNSYNEGTSLRQSLDKLYKDCGLEKLPVTKAEEAKNAPGVHISSISDANSANPDMGEPSREYSTLASPEFQMRAARVIELHRHQDELNDLLDIKGKKEYLINILTNNPDSEFSKRLMIKLDLSKKIQEDNVTNENKKNNLDPDKLKEQKLKQAKEKITTGIDALDSDGLTKMVSEVVNLESVPSLTALFNNSQYNDAKGYNGTQDVKVSDLIKIANDFDRQASNKMLVEYREAGQKAFREMLKEHATFNEGSTGDKFTAKSQIKENLNAGAKIGVPVDLKAITNEKETVNKDIVNKAVEKYYQDLNNQKLLNENAISQLPGGNASIEEASTGNKDFSLYDLVQSITTEGGLGIGLDGLLDWLIKNLILGFFLLQDYRINSLVVRFAQIDLAKLQKKERETFDADKIKECSKLQGIVEGFPDDVSKKEINDIIDKIKKCKPDQIEGLAKELALTFDKHANKLKPGQKQAFARAVGNLAQVYSTLNAVLQKRPEEVIITALRNHINLNGPSLFTSLALAEYLKKISNVGVPNPTVVSGRQVTPAADAADAAAVKVASAAAAAKVVASAVNLGAGTNQTNTSTTTAATKVNLNVP